MPSYRVGSASTVSARSKERLSRPVDPPTPRQGGVSYLELTYEARNTRHHCRLLMMIPAIASAAADIAMHRDPGCGCCEKWAAQVRQQFGRKVQIIDDANRATFHRRVGVPAQLASCQTAIIDGMAFDGHVPIADMKRVLAQHPKGERGLAVAGMPMGSPAWRYQGQSLSLSGTGGSASLPPATKPARSTPSGKSLC